MNIVKDGYHIWWSFHDNGFFFKMTYFRTVDQLSFYEQIYENFGVINWNLLPGIGVIFCEFNGLLMIYANFSLV